MMYLFILPTDVNFIIKSTDECNTLTKTRIRGKGGNVFEFIKFFTSNNFPPKFATTNTFSYTNSS